MDLTDENRTLVLAALYNNAKPQGRSFLAYRKEHIMSEEEAIELLREQKYFDYLYGRVIKVDLSKNYLDSYLYNRDNGLEAAEKACLGLEV